MAVCVYVSLATSTLKKMIQNSECASLSNSLNLFETKGMWHKPPGIISKLDSQLRLRGSCLCADTLAYKSSIFQSSNVYLLIKITILMIWFIFTFFFFRSLSSFSCLHFLFSTTNMDEYPYSLFSWSVLGWNSWCQLSINLHVFCKDLTTDAKAGQLQTEKKQQNSVNK